MNSSTKTDWSALAKEEGFLNEDGSVVTTGYKKPKPEEDSYERNIYLDRLSAGRDGISFTEDRSVMYFGSGEFVEHRRLTEPHLRNYYISANGVLRNSKGVRIAHAHRKFGGKSQYRITIARKTTRYYYADDLLGQVWPEFRRVWNGDKVRIGAVDYQLLAEFPKYAIRKDGRVVRLKDMRIAKVAEDGRIHLSKDGRQYSRMIRKLYRETFGRELGE